MEVGIIGQPSLGGATQYCSCLDNNYLIICRDVGCLDENEVPLCGRGVSPAIVSVSTFKNKHLFFLLCLVLWLRLPLSGTSLDLLRAM